MATAQKAASSYSGAWSDPSNAYALSSDDQYCSYTSTARNGTHEGTFGFAAISSDEIPDGATILSAKVVCEQYQTVVVTGAYIRLNIRLSGSSIGGNTDSTATSDTVIESVATTIPTLQNLRDGVIEAYLLYKRGNSNTSATANADYVYLEVEYSFTGSGSFSADATILSAQQGDTPLDAVILSTGESSFLVEAEVSAAGATVEADFDVDALIEAQQASALAIDAIVSGEVSGSLGTEAILVKAQASTLDVAAAISKQQAASFDTDATFLRSAQEALGADAALRAVLSSSLTAEAVLEAPASSYAPLDAVLQSAEGSDLQLDAVLLLPDVAGQIGLEAAIEGGVAGALDADAVVLATQTLQQPVDAAVRAILETGFEVQAVTVVPQVGDFTDDATIRATQYGLTTLDASLNEAHTGQFTLDGVREVVGQSFFTHDAILLATASDALTLDAVITGGYVSDDFPLDAFIQPYFRADAVVSSNPVFTLDAVLYSIPGIRAVAVGSWTVSTSTTATVTLPSHLPGDMLIVRAACKPYSATVTMATSGWQAAGDRFQNGTTANGDGVGSLALRTFWKIAASSSEPNPVVTWGATAAPGATVAVVYRKGYYEKWFDPVGAGGGDATTASQHAITISSLLPTTAGDMVDYFVGWSNDIFPTFPVLYQEGVVFAAADDYPNSHLSTSSSNDMAADGGYRLATGGEATEEAWIPATSSTAAEAGGWQTLLSIWQTAFTLDADLSGEDEVRGSFTMDALRGRTTVGAFGAGADIAGTLTLDAFIAYGGFTASAIIGTLIHPYASFRVRAWLAEEVTTVEVTGIPIDAYLDSWWSYTTFTIDAEVIGTERLSSFSVAADLSLPGEQRGSLAADATVRAVPGFIFRLHAVIVQAAPFTLDAVVMPSFGVDAYVAQWFTLDAAIDHGFVADAVVAGPLAGNLQLDAVIDIGWHPFTLDAQFAGTVEPDGFEVVALIYGQPSSSFGLDAYVPPSFLLDAFVQPSFYVDAYIMGTDFVVYPPSQSGVDGRTSGTSTFISDSASFDETITSIVIEGVPYTVTSVIDGSTITVSPALQSTGQNLEWSISSGSPTDPLGEMPTIVRRFSVGIWYSSPPDRPRSQWVELTPDVMWAQTEFVQAAKYGPGTFRISLRGAFDFTAGEEVVLEIDGFRVFGGYVMRVERGYVFPDSYDEPVTVLHGVDYNIVFDRLVLYNADWVRRHGETGEYKDWKPFPAGTSDRDIILGIVSDSLTDMSRYGFDFTTYVDEIDTPAPETGWTMEPGVTWRTVMQSISQITAGVWWIDATKSLHYHSRSEVSAPFPITDGDGGIACREFKITSDISPMVSDTLVWGTLAWTTEGEIMYARQPADDDSGVQYWERKITSLQGRIDDVKLIAPSERSVKQRTNLAAWEKTLDIYLRRLARAQEAALEGYPQGIYGLWQYGESRSDIHHQSWLDKRASSIFERYSVPVVKAEATIFDLGYQAGMVASVVSSANDTAADLVIRQMTIRFAVGKEPEGGRYYAVPRYELVMGLDPEEPWDIYDYLPWPIDIKQRKFNRRTGGVQEVENIYGMWVFLDTFSRTWVDEDDFGTADNEREETRDWHYVEGGST